jgi:hypothetical protein
MEAVPAAARRAAFRSNRFMLRTLPDPARNGERQATGRELRFRGITEPRLT